MVILKAVRSRTRLSGCSEEEQEEQEEQEQDITDKLSRLPLQRNSKSVYMIRTKWRQVCDSSGFVRASLRHRRFNTASSRV